MPIPLSSSNYYSNSGRLMDDQTQYGCHMVLDDREYGGNYYFSKPSKKLQVKYRECLRNHAASIGGNATDGCGEFMPASGEADDHDEGSTITRSQAALTCSACNCHRNFHRKVVLGDQAVSHPRIEIPHQMMIIRNYYNRNHEDQDQLGGKSVMKPLETVKKRRFRTRFTQYQKEKLHSFAGRVGWRMHRQEDSLIQSFCQEIGISRRVFKVWMHNNKQKIKKPAVSSRQEQQV